jgi:DNA-binding SARP family transcriptional activator/tetratricopeptide (TPR) repeat protein
MGAVPFLKTLGFPELREPDGRPLKLKVRKHLALLIYLAVDYRGTHRREELIELFWGNVDLERGRHSLSVALSVLRTALGADAIHSTNSHVNLVRTALALDLDLLGRGEILGNSICLPIEVDRFLLDFEIDDAPAFQHWRDRQFTQLLPAIQAGLLTLIDHARRSGDMTRMLTLAERLLALDPLAEEGIRAKMHALAMKGDRVSALRAYEEWKSDLIRELGAVPSELLEGVAARLRGRTLERSRVAEPSVRTEHWADRGFVGRSAEFRELVDAWESTTQLNTRHVLITGDTGVGKSTLAMRFGTSAALEGAAVARVQCFELEQRIAFGMIGALVTSLLDRPGAIGTAPESLAEIARVVPRVRERFPNLPAPPRTEGEAARLHFAEGVFALFDAIMEEQPLVLIVDDYPRSDEASLSVLHMLLRRAGTDRVMVVLAGRPPEPDEPAQARRIREGLSYLPMRHIELAPLSEEESDAMLGGILRGAGKEPAAPVRRAILLASGGNPMALDLLAQDWAAHGDAAMAISLPAMQSDMPASALEAMGYDKLIERMLPGLVPRTRAALQLAAILGPRLNDLECFDIVSLTPTQTMAAMSELVARRLIRDVDGRLEFVNELVRARLYLKIPSTARTRMHDGVANRLLAAGAVGESIPGLEIAWHCIRARRREQATPFLMSGAREAILHGAPDEATRALSSALSQLRGRSRDEAALLLAEAYQEMGDWKPALECIGELSQEHRSDSYLSEMAALLEIESKRHIGHYSSDQLSGVAEQLLSRAHRSRSRLAQVHAALLAAQHAAVLRSADHICAVLAMLATIPPEQLDIRSQGKLLLAKAVMQYHLRGDEKGMSEALAGAQLLEESGATDTTYSQIENGIGAITCVEGRYSDGISHLRRAFRAAKRLDNDLLMSQAAANLALCYYRIGEAEDHARWATIAFQCSRVLEPGTYDRVNTSAHCCLCSMALGRSGDTTRYLSALRQEIADAKLPWIRQAAMIYEADVLWLRGDRSQALRAVERMRNQSGKALSIGFVGSFTRWSTLYLVATNREAELRELLESSRDKLDQLDALDRAEVLWSIEYVRRTRGLPFPDVTSQARAILSRLPASCSHQLSQLGLLLAD